jgi:tol-pal system protein YbgF
MQLRHGLALLMLIGSTAALAQVQVREVGTSRNATAAAPVAQQPGTNTEFVATLYNQVEALQQEVQTLRGVLEEQGYQLKRLQTEQKDRYLDIDRRLSAINNPSASTNNAARSAAPALPPPPSLDASSAAPNSATTVSTLPAPPPQSNVTPAAKKVADNGMDEQELYRTALNLLLQENKAEASVPMFQSYIDTFPTGRLFTNALYWQGEAYLVIAANDKARDVFLRLLADYPADAKAAGAMLKLGVAYKKLGDKAKAMETWKQIRTKFPENANEIRLAEENLKAP